MPEYEDLRLIDRFGYKACHGDALLPYRDAKRMRMVEAVIKAHEGRANYKDKNGQENWAEWAQKFPQASDLLNFAMKCATDEGLLDG